MNKAITIISILILMISSSVCAITTIEVNELDLVDLNVDAEDLDEDAVKFYFSEPLNSTGQWQTTYGDYGKHYVNVSASDGKLRTTKTILIKVNKVNWPPEIKNKDEIFKETDLVKIDPDVYDEEDDEIDIAYSSPLNQEGEWQTDYDDAGTYNTTITASDGQHTVEKTITLTIKDLNRIPKITYISKNTTNIDIKENEMVDFEVKAYDPDGDELEYSWILDDKKKSSSTAYVYKADYESSGQHTLVLKISDKLEFIKKTWNIDVENVNRAPKIISLPDITVDENKTIELELEVEDPDGDDIFYSISDPIGNDKIWTPSFEDAGEYDIDIIVSDGSLQDKGTFKIKVNNVDRPSVFEEIESKTITEEQMITFKPKAADPDGDNVTISIKELPREAEFKESTFILKPDYETFRKPDNWFSKILKTLRLDNIYYGNSKDIPITFYAKSKNLTTEYTVHFYVKNVNLAPEITVDNLEFTELDTVEISPIVHDPDNDRINIWISNPVGNDGKWKTDYEDEGTYKINVSASDGEKYVEEQITLKINKKNRDPVIKGIGDKLKINEGETAAIKPSLYDPDQDTIELSIKSSPSNAELINRTFIWTPGFSRVNRKDSWWNSIVSKMRWTNRKFSTEKEIYPITFIAKDDDNGTAEKTINIIVKNSNLVPNIISTTPSIPEYVAYAGIPVEFEVVAEDPDNDPLEYIWEVDGKEYKGADKLQRTYTTLGEKEVSVTVSDGRSEKEFTWNIEVTDKPVAKKDAHTIIYKIDN